MGTNIIKTINNTIAIEPKEDSEIKPPVMKSNPIIPESLIRKREEAGIFFVLIAILSLRFIFSLF